MRRAIAIATIVAASACDASEPIPFTPTEGAVDVPLAESEFCATLALDACAVARPCCEASPFAFEEAKCRLTVRSVCEARKARALGFGPGYTYDPVLASRCAHGVAALVRDCQRVPPSSDPAAWTIDEACQFVWHGTTPLGNTCSSGTSVECDQPAKGMAVCAPSGKGFESCTVVQFAQAGEPCSGVVGSQCAPGLVCDGTPARCTAAVHPLGAPCTGATRQTGPTSDVCGRDRYCDSSGVCAELPGAGERCSSSIYAVDLCRTGYSCDTENGNVCTDAKSLGSACSANGDCASAKCDQNLCVPNDLTSPFVCDGALFTDLGGFVSLPSFTQGGGAN
jgi:hypothetical protein